MKKKSLLLVLTFVLVFVLVFATACNKHTHEWGAWEITTAPTATDGGVATRRCTTCEAEDAVETADLPALSDSAVWTKTSTTPATHTTDGSEVYSSDYGTVTVVLEKGVGNHTYTWSIVTDNAPTLTAAGKVHGVCACGDTKDETIAKLSDTTVWTAEVTKASTCSAQGSANYTAASYNVSVKNVALAIDENAHVWGTDWTLTKDPTLAAFGTATCACTLNPEHVKTDEQVAKLIDTTVWTVNPAKHVDPACETDGKDVFTSAIYGEVTVTLPRTDHDYGDWELTKEPTESAPGAAQRICANNPAHVDTKNDVPALSDSSWELTATVQPSYSAAGSKTYTHAVWGPVTVPYGEKLAAPFASKTYHSLNVGINDKGVAKVESAWAAATLTVDADGVGVGEAYPFRGKFVIEIVDAAEGKIKITSYAIKSSGASLPNEDDEYEEFDPDYDYEARRNAASTVEYEEQGKVINAWMDFATGVMVIPVKGLSEVTVCVPGDSAMERDKMSACAFGDMMVVSYELAKDNSLGLWSDGSAVMFGVYALDMFGEELDEDSFSVRIYKQSDDSLVAAYAQVSADDQWIETDGLEGIYLLDPASKQEDMGIAVVLGTGEMFLVIDEEHSLSGWYKNLGGGKLGVWITAEKPYLEEDIYVEVTFSGDGLSEEGGLYDYVIPMVTITLNMNGVEINEAEDWADEHGVISAQVNKNILLELPTPTAANNVFRGWYLDKTCTQIATDDNGLFNPVSDATLYAKWDVAIVATLKQLPAGEPDKLQLAEGDYLMDYLPKYEPGYRPGLYLGFWSITHVNGSPLQTPRKVAENTQIDPGVTSLTISAVWYSIPAYYGTYTGTEYRSIGWSDGAQVTVSIDLTGNISCEVEKNGSNDATAAIKALNGAQVTAYNQETKVLSYKVAGDDATEHKIFFDAELGILVGLGKGKAEGVIGDGYFLLAGEKAQIGDRYIIAVALSGDNCADLLVIDGKIVMFYLNKIYANVQICDILGNSLSVADLASSKSAIIRDASSNVVLAVGTHGVGLANNSGIGTLDNLYGSYTVSGNNDLGEAIVLDGMGVISGANATYAKVAEDATSITLDVYVVAEDVATAYYKVVLDVKARTAVVSKPVAEVSFTVSGADVEISSIDANVNIPCAMPVAPVAEGRVFVGYFYDAEGTRPVGNTLTATSTTPIALHAIYSNAVNLTVVYNNGADDEVIPVTIGESKELSAPTYAKHVFEGWYTTPNFATGSEWVSGETVVAADITIYAKWGDAPIFAQTYAPFGFQTEDGKVALACRPWDRTSYKLAVDEYGRAVSGGTPFGAIKDDVVVSYVGNSTTDIIFTCISYETEYTGGTSVFKLDADGNKIVKETKIYKAVIDPVTGVIVMAHNSGEDAVISADTVWLLLPEDLAADATYAGVYWASGNVRVISYTIDGTTRLIYVAENTVIFDVSLADAEGTAIALADILANDAIVIKKGGETVATSKLKVAITIVYGNGLDNASTTVLAGETLSLAAFSPAYTNGKILDCWCTDSALEVPFTATSIVEDITLYCKWKESVYAVTSNHETMPWVQTADGWESYGAGTSTAMSGISMEITFYAAAHVQFKASVSSGGDYSSRYLQVYLNDESQGKGSSSSGNSFELYVQTGDVLKLSFTRTSYYNCYGIVSEFEVEKLLPVTLTYNYQDGGAHANKDMEFTAYDKVNALEEVSFKNGAKVFAGWFTKDGTDDDWGTEFAIGTRITADMTLYAKWLDEVVLTVIYANAPAGKTNINAMETAQISYPAGFTIAPVAPVYTDGMAFSHWSETCDGEAITWTTISENKTIYAVWVEAHAMYGDYVGGEWYYASNASTFSGSTGMGGSLKVEADGSTTNSKVGTLTVLNGVDESNSYRVITDAVNGIIVCNYGKNKTGIEKDMHIYIRTASGASCEKSETLSWGSEATGFSTVARIDLANGNKMFIFLDNANSKVYGNVTIEVGGNAITSVETLRTAGTIFTIKSSAGVELSTFRYTSSKVEERDAVVGTYHTSGTDNAMVLDGFGNLTITNAALSLTYATGTYVATTTAGKYDVVINEDNYALEILAGNLYTLVKPMFTVTFDMNGVTPNATIDAQSVNVGKKWTAVANPTATGYVFDGWYKESACSGEEVSAPEVVNAPVTYYAKWLQAFTVTVHNYSVTGGVAATTGTYDLSVVQGAEPDFSAIIGYIGGQLLTGYYTDPELATPYVSAAVAGNIDVYAKWETTAKLADFANTKTSTAYGWVYDEATGIWQSVCADNQKATLTISAATAVTVTFSYRASSESATQYDYFHADKGTTVICTAGGYNTENADDIASKTWLTATITLSAGDVLTLTYQKDGSVKRGSDKAQIKDLKIAGVAIVVDDDDTTPKLAD